MDNLEQFVKDNREDLDRYEPSTRIWEEIRRNTPKNRKKLIIRLSAAAMITVVIGTAFITYILSRPETATSSAGSRMGKELKEAEIFYNSVANSLYIEARPLLTSQPDVERELNSGLAQIDSICADIKKDLKDNIANQEVIEALIRNYMIKIQLLEEMLGVLRQNETDNEKKESHEL